MYYYPVQSELSKNLRRDYGIDPHAMVYFCDQTLFKYLPQYDQIFPRIAKQVPGSQFVFRQFFDSIPLSKVIERRLQRTFAEYGLDAEEYLVWLPFLSTPEYQRVHQLVDIFLDSIGWSGGTTTLESLPFGLPVVTKPSDLCRTRTSYGILRRMGVLDTVAGSIDEYIKIAVRLGNDPQYRAAISEKMLANQQRVPYDQQTVHALEQFIESVV